MGFGELVCDIINSMNILELSPSTEHLKEILQGLAPEGFSKLKESFAGKSTVDIGGGNSQEVEKLVLENGGSYINVDPHPNVNPRNKDNTSLERQTAEHYLTHASFVFSGGVNFSLNGLDDFSYKGDFHNLADLIKMQMITGNFVFGSGNSHSKITTYFDKDEYTAHLLTPQYFIFEKR